MNFIVCQHFYGSSLTPTPCLFNFFYPVETGHPHIQFLNYTLYILMPICRTKIGVHVYKFYKFMHTYNFISCNMISVYCYNHTMPTLYLYPCRLNMPPCVFSYPQLFPQLYRRTSFHPSQFQNHNEYPL